MKRKIMIYTLAVGAALLTGCVGDGDTSEVAEISKDYLSMSTTDNLSLSGDETQGTLTIESNCTWSISETADWMTVSPTTGESGKKTVTITVDKNTTGDSRSAELRISGGSLQTRTITVTQAKGTPVTPEPVETVLTVNETTLSFESAGGSQTFNVTSNTDWTVSAPSWCQVTPSRGESNATIIVKAEENPNSEQRSGEITVSGTGVEPAVIRVTQKSAESTSHEPNPGDNLPPS